MKSRPGQGLIVISKKIRLKQNDHASRRTQRSPHTRRQQHRPKPPPTLAASTTAQNLPPHSPLASTRPNPSPEHPTPAQLRQPAPPSILACSSKHRTPVHVRLDRRPRPSNLSTQSQESGPAARPP